MDPTQDTICIEHYRLFGRLLEDKITVNLKVLVKLCKPNSNPLHIFTLPDGNAKWSSESTTISLSTDEVLSLERFKMMTIESSGNLKAGQGFGIDSVMRQEPDDCQIKTPPTRSFIPRSRASTTVVTGPRSHERRASSIHDAQSFSVSPCPPSNLSKVKAIGRNLSGPQNTRRIVSGDVVQHYKQVLDNVYSPREGPNPFYPDAIDKLMMEPSEITTSGATLRLDGALLLLDLTAIGQEILRDSIEVCFEIACCLELLEGEYILNLGKLCQSKNGALLHIRLEELGLQGDSLGCVLDRFATEDLCFNPSQKTLSGWLNQEPCHIAIRIRDHLELADTGLPGAKDNEPICGDQMVPESFVDSLTSAKTIQDQCHDQGLPDPMVVVVDSSVERAALDSPESGDRMNLSLSDILLEARESATIDEASCMERQLFGETPHKRDLDKDIANAVAETFIPDANSDDVETAEEDGNDPQLSDCIGHNELAQESMADQILQSSDRMDEQDRTYCHSKDEGNEPSVSVDDQQNRALVIADDGHNDAALSESPVLVQGCFSGSDSSICGQDDVVFNAPDIYQGQEPVGCPGANLELEHNPHEGTLIHGSPKKIDASSEIGDLDSMKAELGTLRSCDSDWQLATDIVSSSEGTMSEPIAITSLDSDQTANEELYDDSDRVMDSNTLAEDGLDVPIYDSLLKVDITPGGNLNIQLPVVTCFFVLTFSQPYSPRREEQFMQFTIEGPAETAIIMARINDETVAFDVLSDISESADSRQLIIQTGHSGFRIGEAFCMIINCLVRDYQECAELKLPRICIGDRQPLSEQILVTRLRYPLYVKLDLDDILEWTHVQDHEEVEHRWRFERDNVGEWSAERFRLTLATLKRVDELTESAPTGEAHVEYSDSRITNIVQHGTDYTVDLRLHAEIRRPMKTMYTDCLARVLLPDNCCLSRAQTRNSRMPCYEGLTGEIVVMDNESSSHLCQLDLVLQLQYFGKIEQPGEISLVLPTFMDLPTLLYETSICAGLPYNIQPQMHIGIHNEVPADGTLSKSQRCQLLPGEALTLYLKPRLKEQVSSDNLKQSVRALLCLMLIFMVCFGLFASNVNDCLTRLSQEPVNDHGEDMMQSILQEMQSARTRLDSYMSTVSNSAMCLPPRIEPAGKHTTASQISGPGGVPALQGDSRPRRFDALTEYSTALDDLESKVRDAQLGQGIFKAQSRRKFSIDPREKAQFKQTISSMFTFWQ